MKQPVFSATSPEFLLTKQYVQALCLGAANDLTVEEQTVGSPDPSQSYILRQVIITAPTDQSKLPVFRPYESGLVNADGSKQVVSERALQISLSIDQFVFMPNVLVNELSSLSSQYQFFGPPTALDRFDNVIAKLVSATPASTPKYDGNLVIGVNLTHLSSVSDIVGDHRDVPLTDPSAFGTDIEFNGLIWVKTKYRTLFTGGEKIFWNAVKEAPKG